MFCYIQLSASGPKRVIAYPTPEVGSKYNKLLLNDEDFMNRVKLHLA